MNNKFNKNATGHMDIKELLIVYTKHWKWFLLSVFIAFALAFFYIRYATPEYSANARIHILEERGPSPELSVFQDLGAFSGGTNKVEDEIEIINSRSNHIEVVKELGLNMKVILLGKIKNSELYRSYPFKINFIAPDSVIYSSKTEFFIEISSKTIFGYAEMEDLPDKPCSFGKNVTTPIGDIVITPTKDNMESYIGSRFHIIINPVVDVAEAYQKKVMIAPADQFSNIANISLNDPIPLKAKNIIDALINTYNRNAIIDKKTIADRTSDFINERIISISSSLSTVDESAEEFKAGRGITDIASEANINLNIGAANRQELENVSVQLDIASSMKEIVESQDSFEPLPANVGLADASIASTTARYNELALERKRLLKSSNERNPIIVNLDQQLNSLKQNVQSSLNSVTNNLELTVNSLSSQQSKLNSRIYSVPKNERALRDITRKQQTTEALYLYLLQKREESQITYASANPKSKIIDTAYSTGLPVSPKPMIIFLASFIMGLMIPFSVIYANDLLDNKVHSKTTLEKLIKDIPVLGELPKLGKKEAKLVGKDDRSILAESLRIIRTNIDYMMKSKNSTGKGKGNLIYITSSVPGEGKTFLSSNLSMIFASTNKKVLLIGADIRNPKLYNFFNNKNVGKLGGSSRNRDIGLTEYLYDRDLGTNDIINSMLVHTNTIDVIYSGKIPPNPAELLMSTRMKELLEEVSEKYDYVIVDTAPLMVVTDTLLITEYADHIIYVTKAGVTEKRVLEFPMKLKNEGKLNGLSFVVNNVKASNLGYGGSYGYGYGKSHKKWWTF